MDLVFSGLVTPKLAIILRGTQQAGKMKCRKTGVSNSNALKEPGRSQTVRQQGVVRSVPK